MLTEDQIQFLNRVCPDRWAEENGVINANGLINMEHMNLTKIPVQFEKIDGSFSCGNNKLTSLEGCPSIVTHMFSCNNNVLTSLIHGPKEVQGFYTCRNNILTNLIGAPNIGEDNFNCEHNQLTSLEGCPKLIRGNLFCKNNQNLEYLWGIGYIEENIHFYFDKNEIINKWIIKCAYNNIIFPFGTLEKNMKWIRDTNKYHLLLTAPEEIRQHFSPRILHLVDSGVYNESKKYILSFKKFVLNEDILGKVSTTIDIDWSVIATKHALDRSTRHVEEGGEIISKKEMYDCVQKGKTQLENLLETGVVTTETELIFRNESTGLNVITQVINKAKSWKIIIKTVYRNKDWKPTEMRKLYVISI